MAIPTPKPCTCGHAAEGHQHYRAGTDCSRCGCRAYRPRARPSRLRRLLARLRRRDDIEALVDAVFAQVDNCGCLACQINELDEDDLRRHPDER